MKKFIIAISSVSAFICAVLFMTKCNDETCAAEYLRDCKLKGDSVEFVENYAVANQSVIQKYEDLMEERAQNIQNAEENTKIAIEAWQK